MQQRKKTLSTHCFTSLLIRKKKIIQIFLILITAIKHRWYRNVHFELGQQQETTEDMRNIIGKPRRCCRIWPTTVMLLMLMLLLMTMQLIQKPLEPMTMTINDGKDECVERVNSTLSDVLSCRSISLSKVQQNS